MQGSGQLIVNNKNYKQYFPFALWQEVVTEPLPLVGLDKDIDISVKVSGGGLPAQAEAIRLALARALLVHNADWRPVLRKMGYLTRDPREKERKKPGLKRARRAPQWQKR
ncbi:30S ribosomal protein S9 [Candidatus Uhrbacteria bacterium RIFCSPLOWO2_02_FULL_48_12]|uniref:30S ribosomal protein S9 n=1 Tax=Candidatus Uhrbacteria bacterium RIFCSPLOWO2_02_FULL_48_12 TaxID=1802407 RepID=A0A1F7VB42_9BACT|nr:MAG: 30S ribosomal protein S9 [Candidatus Uhrbacteria bacterium RIFCSPLOWO2_02_FULL_48_12]